MKQRKTAVGREDMSLVRENKAFRIKYMSWLALTLCYIHFLFYSTSAVLCAISILFFFSELLHKFGTFIKNSAFLIFTLLCTETLLSLQLSTFQLKLTYRPLEPAPPDTHKTFNCVATN